MKIAEKQQVSSFFYEFSSLKIRMDEKQFVELGMMRKKGEISKREIKRRKWREGERKRLVENPMPCNLVFAL